METAATLLFVVTQKHSLLYCGCLGLFENKGNGAKMSSNFLLIMEVKHSPAPVNVMVLRLRDTFSASNVSIP